MSNPLMYYSNKTSYKFNERNWKNKRKTGTARQTLCYARRGSNKQFVKQYEEKTSTFEGPEA